MAYIDKKIFQWGNIEIGNTPNIDYQLWLKKTNSYFDSEDWGQVLKQGFNAERYYLWDHRNKTGLSLTIFKKGPFRMGFLGFPACVMHWEKEEPYRLDEMVESVKYMPGKPHLVKITPSQFSNINLSHIEGKRDITIETCISPLTEWSAESEEKRRRAWRRSNRKCAELGVEETPSGKLMQFLYEKAIDKNHGKAKYGQAYFETLETQTNTPNITVKFLNSFPAQSMVISGFHGKTAYYLHGGSTPEAMDMGASDFLMKHSIEDAKEKGFESFNFLSSPKNQPGLIKFKEKWGGKSKELITYTFYTGHIGRLLIKLI